MPSNLSSLESLMSKGLGGRDDTAAMAVIDACLNYAITLAALLFEPPELLEQSNLTITANNSNVSIGTLTDLLDVKAIYNNTDGNKMWFIPWESWYIVLPANVGAVKYFSIFGESLYVKDTPTVNKVLAVSYSTYPSKLSSAGDIVEFDYHDSFIVATALGIAWAFFEKGKSTTVEGAISMITLPLSLGAKARQIIEGQKTSLEVLFAQQRGEK